VLVRRACPSRGIRPDSVRITDIARAGQKTLEHLTGVLVECSSRETELREALRKGAPSIDFGPMGPAGRITLDTFDAAKAGALFARLRQVAVVPTMSWERAYIHLDETAKRTADEWRWVPGDVRRDAALTAAVKRRRPETDGLMKEYYRAAASLLGKMHRAGVPILAGTDGGDEFTVPGYALHDEMELLVEAGFSPLDALKAASTKPAQMFGLVILSANPLTDIRNTRRIEAVVLRGRVLRKGDAPMTPAPPRFDAIGYVK
jgi:hypothetical protein